VHLHSDVRRIQCVTHNTQHRLACRRARKGVGPVGGRGLEHLSKVSAGPNTAWSGDAPQLVRDP
jgi:hypothetical protein